MTVENTVENIEKKLKPVFKPVRYMYQEVYGHLPAPSTVTQMKHKGLKTVRIAGKLCCTEEALRAFVEGAA
jgi:hypothetical protein